MEVDTRKGKVISLLLFFLFLPLNLLDNYPVIEVRIGTLPTSKIPPFLSSREKRCMTARPPFLFFVDAKKKVVLDAGEVFFFIFGTWRFSFPFFS